MKGLCFLRTRTPHHNHNKFIKPLINVAAHLDGTPPIIFIYHVLLLQ